MAYTTHGHHIPGTVMGLRMSFLVVDCGGVRSTCSKCYGQAWHATTVKEEPGPLGREVSLMMREIPMQDKARIAVANYFNEHRFDANIAEVTLKDIKVVWFSKVLDNWKAICIVDVPNGTIYEVTYSGAMITTYVDVYSKTDNVAIHD